MALKISAQFDPEREPGEKELLAKLACQVVRFTLRSEERKFSAGEVSLLFTDDAFIARLNEKYRDERGPTDVLSFPMLNFGSDNCIQEAWGLSGMLGDIVISLETAARCAEEHGVSLRREVALLLVHGTLHLLGYDHDEPQKEAVMWAKQEAILKALNI